MPAVRVPLHLRWADLDAYGHVNNAAIVGLLEQARVLAFWNDADPILPPLTADADTWVLVAGVEVAYLKPIDHRTEPITAELSIVKAAGATFVIAYRLLVDEVECVRATTTMALVDPATGAPTRMTSRLRERLLAYGE